MIKRLKKKFVILATLSMLALMLVLVVIMNGFNFASVTSESDKTLEILTMPNLSLIGPSQSSDFDAEKIKAQIPRGMSPEVPYESRFFTVLVDGNGDTKNPDFSRIISIDEDTAKEYVATALARDSERGYIGTFRFLKVKENEDTRLLFLDCGRKLAAFRTFCMISVGAGLLGCLVVFLVFLFVSGRIVKPIAESYEKQKRFISDAGHELKTPLTIINANADLIACNGETEELAEIRNQTKRLTLLTNNLVMLSKMEESQQSIQKIEMPLSDIVRETAASFQALALSRKIDFQSSVMPDLSMVGSPDSIAQLVSILLDNAMKYSPAEGRVCLELTAGKRSATLCITNSVTGKINENDLSRVFDRFYRTDESRNAATGGHGIGLSIAQAIVLSHGGNITAKTRTGFEFVISATLPL